MQDDLMYGQPQSAFPADAVRAQLEAAFAAHLKGAPRPAVVDVVRETLDELQADPGFLPWLARALQDMPELPRNLVLWLRRTAWPAYVAEACTGAIAGEILSGRPDCQECRGTGWHRVWPASGDPTARAVCLPCTCNGRLQLEIDAPVRGWTRAELEATGAWRWTDPAEDALLPDDPDWTREAVQKAAGAAPAEDGVPDIPF